MNLQGLSDGLTREAHNLLAQASVGSIPTSASKNMTNKGEIIKITVELDFMVTLHRLGLNPQYSLIR